jgi:hypothetical protein
VQSNTAPDALQEQSPPAPTSPGHEFAAVAFMQDEAARSREELTMLFIGFGTGLTIALIFLTYIVLATTNILP